MKKTSVFAFLALMLFSACQKEECDCQKVPDIVNFGIRTSHYPINSTDLPAYKIGNDTIELPLFLSHRSVMDYPPGTLGMDYRLYETDQTRFSNQDFGLSYFSIAAADPNPHEVHVNWFAVMGLTSNYQKYSMEFFVPISSNETGGEVYILDSLQVLDKWYEKVLSGPVHKSHQEGIAYEGAVPERFYYSAAYGIVQLDMSDGSVWELLGTE